MMPGIAGTPKFTPAGAGGLATQAEINALKAGMETAFTQLENSLIDQVFGDALPIVGDQLKIAAGQGTGPLRFFSSLKSSLNASLNTLQGATSTTAQVQQAIQTGLASASIVVNSLEVNANNPTDLKLNLNVGRSFLALAVPLDAGLGIPGLGMQTSGSAGAALNYALNFSMGVDSQGFYISPPNSNLRLLFSITFPGLDASAKLSKLRFRITDESATDGDSVAASQFQGTFQLGLTDPNADHKLRLANFTSGVLAPTLSGNAAINLNLASDLGDADFPSVAADLNFSWAFNSAPVVPGDANAAFGTVPQVAFRKVTVDAGTFFSKFARPVLLKVREITEPLQPLVKAVKEPIPLLEELHSINENVPQSLLEMAVKNGSISQAQADQFDTLSRIIQISNAIPPDGATTVKIDLGDFDLGTADPRAPNFNIAGITPNKIRNAATAALQDPTVQAFLQQTGAFPKGVQPGGLSKGLQFPIIENPETMFGLLLGKNVDLFILDNATQNLPLYQINEFIRISGPFGFRFQGQGDIRVDLDFGFDTRGLLKLINGGSPPDVLAGFYVAVPQNSSGHRISMAELNARMNASAALNAVVAEIGAGGYLNADAHATLTDPDNDGRVHLDEFYEEFELDPLCILQADGKLDFGLRAYVTLGYSVLSKTIDFEIPFATILDFSHACDNSPYPILAHQSGGDVKLHIGPDAASRISGDLTDSAEIFNITRRGSAPGSEELNVTSGPGGGAASNGPAQAYNAIGGVIRGDGGEQNDTITLSPDVVTAAILNGGGGLDRLTGGMGNDQLSGGPERDFLFGNAGNDTLHGDGAADVLDGGPGADAMDGGDGIDAVSYARAPGPVGINLVTGVGTGDAAGDTFISIEQIEGSAYGDSITGGAGTDLLFGLAGNDLLNGGEGDDGLEGGPGADHLIGGPGYDFTTYWFSPAGVNVNLLTGAASGGDAQGDFLEGMESIAGSAFADVLTGNDADNEMTGYEGSDTLSGGPGADTLFGDEGDDILDGGDGNDNLDPGTGEDSTHGGAGEDAIILANDWGNFPDPLQPNRLIFRLNPDYADGGAGNDYLVAGGADTVDGGDGDDYVVAGTGPQVSSPAPPEAPYPRLLGESVVGNGGSVLRGGAGNDTVNFEGHMTSAYAPGVGYRNMGVLVNLSTNFTNYAAAETSISGFENVIGTDAGDDLTGTDGPNIFEPLRGGGYSSAFTSGPDRINGLGGEDLLRLDFTRAAASQGVYTNGGTMSTNLDSFFWTNVERLEVIGTPNNDVIYNYLDGLHDDILTGNAGNDDLGAGRGGGNDTLIGGEGNDRLFAHGTFDVSYDGTNGTAGGRDFLDGGPGDDQIENFTLLNNVPTLSPDALFKIDGGPGFDTVSMNFSNQTIPMIFNGPATTSWEFPDGAYVRNFERIRHLAAGSGDDNIRQPGRFDNLIFLNGGNDTVDAGLGVDVVEAGAGDDSATIDFSVGDTADMGGITGGGVSNYSAYFSRARVVSPFGTPDYISLRNFEHIRIIGTSKVDKFFGTYASETVIAGDGDDIIGDGYTGGNDVLEGGRGNDKLTGSSGEGNTGGNDNLDGGEGDDLIYPLIGDDVVRGGPGNDLIQADQDFSAGYGSDTFDGGEGDDTIIDLYFNSHASTLTTPQTRLRLDGGPGIDTLHADFGNETTGISFIQGQINSTEFPGGSYFRNFEKLGNFITGSGNDRIILNGRVNNIIGTGAGNDEVNPGLGNHYEVHGGPGDDLLILDYSTGDYAGLDAMKMDGASARRRDLNIIGQVVYPDYIFFTGFNRFDITATDKNDSIRGQVGNDILRGGGGSDEIDGYDGDDVIIGSTSSLPANSAEIDSIYGSGGADLFVLGDTVRRFYDDAVPGNPGLGSYAKLLDFNPTQGDKLRLFGPSSDYLIGPSPVAGITGTALFHDSNQNGTLEPASDELIATLGTNPVTVANTLTPAQTAAAVDISLAGVSDVSVSNISGGGAGTVGLTFRMLDPLPPGVRIEVQGSSDLGLTDQWQTLASKTGSSVWSGPAAVTVEPAGAGRVAVTVTPVQPLTAVPRLMMRLKVSAF